MAKGETYDQFVEKFIPKKTTDDCYTPDLVYNAVKDWAVKEYNITGQIIRPFWPGADYQAIEYPPDCVVIDNPPFSIVSQIVRFYQNNTIPFFLFTSALRLSPVKIPAVCYIACGENVIFENGAVVSISFVTNMEDPDIILRTAPELNLAIRQAVNETKQKTTKARAKYIYPVHVMTAAKAEYFSAYGINYQVKRTDCAVVSKLDANSKGIFGSGLLLSERAAAERAAAERAAAKRAAAVPWTLSDREKEIIAKLGGDDNGGKSNDSAGADQGTPEG